MNSEAITINEISIIFNNFVKLSPQEFWDSTTVSEEKELKFVLSIDLENNDLSRYDGMLDEALNWTSPKAFGYLLKCIMLSYYRDGKTYTTVIEMLIEDLVGVKRASFCSEKWSQFSTEQLKIIVTWLEDIKCTLKVAGGDVYWVDLENLGKALDTLKH